MVVDSILHLTDKVSVAEVQVTVWVDSRVYFNWKVMSLLRLLVSMFKDVQG